MVEPGADDRWRRARELYLAGDISRAEWEQERSRWNAAKSPEKRVVTGEMTERFFGFGEVWGLADMEDRRGMVAAVFDAVGLDVARKEMYVRPWPEFRDLFEKRVQWCVRMVPPAGIEGSEHTRGWVPMRKLVAA